MPNLGTMPVEISSLINSELDQKDIKQLRLVSREVNGKAKLRIKRVFISRHSAILNITSETINDNEFSKQIEEIVWDNTQHHYPNNMDEFTGLAGRRLNSNNKQLMLSYLREARKLAQSQREILRNGLDLEILQQALKLPNLKRITITSHIWASIAAGAPSYDLPLFRKLYDEFPIDPRPYVIYDRLLYELHRAQVKLQEFVVEVTRERAYIHGHLFWYLCPATHAIKAICTNSNNLTRIDLAINTAVNWGHDVSCFDCGQLKDLLSKLPSLEHLGLHANMYTDFGRMDTNPVSRPLWHSIEGLFPSAEDINFPKLRHLKLANLFVKTSSLLVLLTKLPSLESIDLDRLELCRNTGRFHDLLHGLKRRLVDHEDGIWKEPRTRVTIQSGWRCHAIVEDDITAFFYEGAECPYDPGAYGPKSFWRIDNDYLPEQRVKCMRDQDN
ncbi:hypothetical protein HYFRA_00007298 [Hymenoscyphus fraxineus]|uniref:F-box domain-containing protein n=1 Tax=Hymenoscyphus fraxineus TaxID=746836 RepID=A0A9N9KQ84_9HELO|nr:hypothetical protein HYFRA_00007298 [Hymenoscyphus fraxineus]